MNFHGFCHSVFVNVSAGPSRNHLLEIGPVVQTSKTSHVVRVAVCAGAKCLFGSLKLSMSEVLRKKRIARIVKLGYHPNPFTLSVGVAPHVNSPMSPVGFWEKAIQVKNKVFRADEERLRSR